MRLLVLLCIATLTFALQCPSKLPVTCNCKCYFCAHKYGSISINCSIVPDLYDLLSVLENGTFFEVKIDKCKKPVQNLTKLPSFYTICLLINNCGLEHVVDDAFADIADLELLDLSYNALTKMPVFPKFPMLTYVALNNNLEIRLFVTKNLNGLLITSKTRFQMTAGMGKGELMKFTVILLFVLIHWLQQLRKV
uniref:LRRNT domain-containing protein n=1 Tax=Panagrellus redivivus TaxID=6233 RepID=A0A7E4WBX0_PANRE